MKYQIYLNKKTSTFIETAAEIEGKKPATLIKELVEEMADFGMKTANDFSKKIITEIEKETKKQ